MSGPSSSTNRNPKVLKEIIQNATQQSSYLETSDITRSSPSTSTTSLPDSTRRPSSSSAADLEDAMRNLRNLSAEEKTEIGLLKSRVEEQSRLIMILKQRGDDYINKNMTLEKINQELNQQKEELEKELKTAAAEYSSLEDKFRYLGENHQALIRFKDEYKERVGVLEKENKILTESLKQSKTGDEEKKQLISRLNETERRFLTMEEKYSGVESELARVKIGLENKEIELKCVGKEAEDLRSQNNELNRKYNELTQTCEKLKQLIHDSSETNEKKIQALMNEKNDLELICENLKKEKAALIEANEKSEKNYRSVLQEISKLKEKTPKESPNERLAEANQRIKTLEKDFEAYKKYAASLIEREKELNNKLRFVFN